MEKSETILKSNFTNMYWSPFQQLTHHTVTGCPLKVGDILGSGTVSGPGPRECGSLYELSSGESIKLSNGEVRKYLQDGD
jgi:fumarylacetoacetase